MMFDKVPLKLLSEYDFVELFVLPPSPVRYQLPYCTHFHLVHEEPVPVAVTVLFSVLFS